MMVRNRNYYRYLSEVPINAGLGGKRDTQGGCDPKETMDAVVEHLLQSLGQGMVVVVVVDELLTWIQFLGNKEGQSTAPKASKSC